jgi:hypothetical protein
MLQPNCQLFTEKEDIKKTRFGSELSHLVTSYFYHFSTGTRLTVLDGSTKKRDEFKTFQFISNLHTHYQQQSMWVLM